MNADSCATGNEVPVDIWQIHPSQNVCCGVHHPYSLTCIPPEVVLPPPENTYDDEYEVVIIKFSINGLPKAMNMRELKAEMLIVLKRILIDLMEQVSNLSITNIEENLVMTLMPQNRRRNANADEVINSGYNVYYDVTVVRQPNKEFGPIIIAGLRDSYDIIVQEIEDYTNLKYFAFVTDLNWCTDDNGEQSFAICSRGDEIEIVPVKFRLADLPAELNVKDLVRQVIGFFKGTLVGVEKLEIVEIEENKVVDLSDGGDTIQDVFLDIVLVRKFDVIDFGPAINVKLQNSKNDILNRIQKYTDTSTDLDLNWCINGEGAYAVCPQSDDGGFAFALPTWAIITLAAVSVVLFICICWCILSYLRRRDEYKNERNMMSYLQTGKNYRKQQRPKHRQRQPPPPRLERPRTQSQGFSEEEDPPQRLMLANDTAYLENMPSFIYDNGDDHPRSMGLPKEADPPQRLLLTKDTSYLEQKPSFVFDNAGPSPKTRMLTNGEDNDDGDLTTSKPDPEGEHYKSVLMLEEGPSFAGEESILTPARRK